MCAYYREQWRIEQNFRILKSTLSVRPVYHWTQDQMRAHVAICHTAFAVLKILAYRVPASHQGRSLSEERILHEARLC